MTDLSRHVREVDGVQVVTADLAMAWVERALNAESLLARYLWHIIDCESVSFLSDARFAKAGTGGHSVQFTAEEIVELERLEKLYPGR